MKTFLVFLCCVLIVSHIADVDADERCRQTGGSCFHNYSEVNCYGGWRTGLCDGDANRRCCLQCIGSCYAAEVRYQRRDGRCSGTCADITNYCPSNYIRGMCGGPSTRQCCPNPRFLISTNG